MATVWTPSQSRSGSSSQSTTETAPVGAIGVILSGVVFVAVALHAPAGQTFDGTGSLLGYRNILRNAWARAPRADVDMSDYAGLTDVVLPSLTVDGPVGRFIYIPSGVGLSGGTTITADYLCTTNFGMWGDG